MKKIEAIIRMTKFEEVKKALAEIDVLFFTLHEVKGYGLQKGEILIYRGAEYGTEYIERVQMDIYSTKEKCPEIVDVLLMSGATGEVGDGKIAILPVDTVYRIRNADQNANAI